MDYDLASYQDPPGPGRAVFAVVALAVAGFLVVMALRDVSGRYTDRWRGQWFGESDSTSTSVPRSAHAGVRCW